MTKGKGTIMVPTGIQVPGPKNILHVLGEDTVYLAQEKLYGT